MKSENVNGLIHIDPISPHLIIALSSSIGLTKLKEDAKPMHDPASLGQPSLA